MEVYSRTVNPESFFPVLRLLFEGGPGYPLVIIRNNVKIRAARIHLLILISENVSDS